MKITLTVNGRTVREGEIWPRPVAHANEVDTALPHESLTNYIDELEARINETYRLIDDAIHYCGQMSCNGTTVISEIGCPRCELRRKLEKARRLVNLADKSTTVIVV